MLRDPAIDGDSRRTDRFKVTDGLRLLDTLDTVQHLSRADSLNSGTLSRPAVRTCGASNIGKGDARIEVSAEGNSSSAPINSSCVVAGSLNKLFSGQLLRSP